MNIVKFDLSAAPRTSIDEAKEDFDRAEGAIFLDVRSKEDYDKAHIPGALAISLRELPQRLRELPQDKKIIIY